MKFRKADTRTLWVFAIIAIIILVIILTGTWKRFAFFITFANFFGFESVVPTGTSMIGLNLDRGDLEYFTGEKWVKIKELGEDFHLDVYQFNPNEIKGDISNFYTKTKRYPETFSIDVNHWRYWEENLEENDVLIYSRSKNGFFPDDSLKYFLRHTDDSLREEGKTIEGFTSLFLDFEKSSEILKKTISWRDSILFGGDCEKFVPLKIKFETPHLSFKQDANQPNVYFYQLRKIDEYLVIDLSEPVEFGREDKYKESCFEIESFKDINRNGWKNSAKVIFSYTKYKGDNGVAKIEWDGNRWNYVLKDEDGHFIQDSDSISMFNNLVVGTFSHGLFGLPLFLQEQQAGFFAGNDMGVFVEVPQLNELGQRISLNIDSIKSGRYEQQEFGDWDEKERSKRISQFIYGILNEHNKYLLPPKIPLPDMPEYFFILENDYLVLMNNLGVLQNVVISANDIIFDRKLVGEVTSGGTIKLKYGYEYMGGAIFEGSSPGLDFMNGKNVFEFSYSEIYVHPKVFKKLNRGDIPSATLRNS